MKSLKLLLVIFFVASVKSNFHSLEDAVATQMTSVQTSTNIPKTTTQSDTCTFLTDNCNCFENEIRRLQGRLASELWTKSNEIKNATELILMQKSYADKIEGLKKELGNSEKVHFEFCSNFSWESLSDDLLKGLRQPYHGVSSGNEINEGLILYPIRSTSKNGQFLYGKMEWRSFLKYTAYLNDDKTERKLRSYTLEFEILKASSFNWYKAKKENFFNEQFPICRAFHERKFIPGTLVSPSHCRIGYLGNTFDYEDFNFDILKIRKCFTEN